MVIIIICALNLNRNYVGFVDIVEDVDETEFTVPGSHEFRSATAAERCPSERRRRRCRWTTGTTTTANYRPHTFLVHVADRFRSNHCSLRRDFYVTRRMCDLHTRRRRGSRGWDGLGYIYYIVIFSKNYNNFEYRHLLLFFEFLL